MTTTSYWNEDIGYTRWLRPEFNLPQNLDDFKKMIDACDDSIQVKHLKSLIKKAREILEQEECNQLKKYICSELSLINNLGIQRYLVKIAVPNIIIPFDKTEIEIRDDGIYEINAKINQKKDELEIEEKLILEGCFKLHFKVFDEKLNEDRFTFSLNEKNYHALTIIEALSKLEEKIYYGNRGKDIIKRVFNYLSKRINERKREYVLGFNDGWKLPINEKEKNLGFILYTDMDKEVYRRSNHIIKSYSYEEKEKILKKLKEFIERTQTPPLKLVIIIGWSLSSVFRMSLVDYFEIFPHLYNFGERTAGKGSLEKFWIMSFYKIHEKLLPSKTLESPSRLEDYLASSTFPICITEAEGKYIKNCISILKEHPTDNTDFERKKNAKEFLFKKPKCSGLALDSNHIIEEFRDAALNSKVLLNEFTDKDIPKRDYEWKKLYRELKKEFLFSFVYEATKDWNNDFIFRILELIRKETEEKFPNHEKLERMNPRLMAIFCILKFGLYVFHLSFGFSLDSIKPFTDKKLLNYLIKTRKVIPAHLMDQFYSFCEIALEYDDLVAFQQKPKFLTEKLREHKNGKFYAFSQQNLRDFNEYVRGSTYSKAYSLTSLYNELQDALTNKDDILLKNTQAFDYMKKTNYILIRKSWFKKKEI